MNPAIALLGIGMGFAQLGAGAGSPGASTSPAGQETIRRAPVESGWIAYEDSGGEGPAVLCLPGMGDVRAEYRFLVPLLRQAGYRVLIADLRGHGESSAGFSTYTPAQTGQDALAVLDHAGVDQATLIGCSMSGASIAWAAIQAPHRVEALVMINPFTRAQTLSDFEAGFYRVLFGSLLSRPWGPAVWGQFYASRYSRPPADFKAYRAALQSMLAEPGRIEALRSLMLASNKEISDRLGSVKATTLVLMGGADPDFKSPEAEGRAVQALLGGQARVEVLDGLGHYPHVEDARKVMDALRRVLPEPGDGA